MTLFQMAFRNISRDKHTYFSYYISSTATILLFFLFTAAAMHPELHQIQEGSTLALALAAGNFIIYGFAFLFIGYSSFAFLGSRGKQLGIYTILGMSPKQMKKMLFGENILIGMSALLSGLIGGILFSGLFFKLIRNIFVTISFEMYVPVFPALLTSALFIFLFLVIGFIAPWFISRTKVVWFLKSDQSYAQDAKVSPVKVLAGLLLLAGAAGLLLTPAGDMLGDLFTPAVFFCVVGSVFLLTPQIGGLYSLLRMGSGNHWKGIRLFADREISGTVWENGHMMSLNAVLLAMAFLAMCALGSMQSNVVEDVERIAPFSYLYIERPENHRAQKDTAFLDQLLLGNKDIQKVEYGILREGFSFGFLKESDFNKILRAKEAEEVSLELETVYVLPGNADQKKKEDSIHHKAEDCLREILGEMPRTKYAGQMVSLSGAMENVYVVRDEVWEELKKTCDFDWYMEVYTGYEDKGWLDHLEFAAQAEERLEHGEADYDFTYAFASLGRYYHTELLMRKLCTFVGFSISLIFLVASVSVVYFRLYTSLEREKKKYHSMFQLGFSRKEKDRTLEGKIRVLLWLPFWMAMAVMWAGILYMDSRTAVSIVPMAWKYSLVFIGVYFVFYELVLRVYRSKFTEEA